ncbi:phosphatidylserine decarboxylase [Haloimpatiens lingqiaonensis]|uniref:phosphatidylserine decarboxylase n=1 Tax=Haloimpatiens lingqiaonensis TaxID=1380675 RepID=UPI0010FDF622|nr:phosphatidylserine decarboxylase [Haloimpatiens lingqiaonensis]
MEIKFFDRKNKCYKTEKVAGEKYLNWTYSSPMGMKFLEAVLKKKVFSKLYGHYCDCSLSKRKIPGFIREFSIDTKEFKRHDFRNFNDFFIRELNKDARNISLENNILISPCDGKVLAYDHVDIDSLIQVKGITYSLQELIGNKNIAENYTDGCCLIFRLCPTDYHRFHFVDEGKCSPTQKITGHYYSVNPIALKNVKKLFCQNKREWSILSSKNFNEVLYIEVGATCVGSIIQTYTPNNDVKKGDEKGLFKFGGSTVIIFFQKNSVKIHQDILKQTQLGYECSVILGEPIGTTFVK